MKRKSVEVYRLGWDDVRCTSMIASCRRLLREHAVRFRLCLSSSTVPIVKPGSVLHLRPTLFLHCTFPIDEVIGFDDDEFGEIDPHRSLFYSELNGKFLNDLTSRTKLMLESRRRRRDVY